MLEALKTFLAVASPFLLLGLAGLGALYKMERDRRREVELRLNEQKSKIYSEFIESYSGLFFKENGKEKTQKDFDRIIMDTNKFARKALLYASDEVMREFHVMYKLLLTPLVVGQEEDGVKVRMRAFANLVRAIRKELGHSNTRLSTDIVGGILITDYN